MRILLVAAAGLAVAATTAGTAQAFETVLGGLAGACSSEAKQAVNVSHILDLCTQALDRETLPVRDRAGTFVNRGSMYLLMRSWELAHDDFQSALRLWPKLGEAHVGEGAYLLTQGRFDESEQETQRGLDLGTEEPEKAYYIRGMARWGEDDFGGAYADFHKALELKPTWDLPRQQLTHFSVKPAG